jgi:hypothetical protein
MRSTANLVHRSSSSSSSAHESPDLAVGLALGVKVGSSLSTAHHQTSQGVLEDLLETEADISTIPLTRSKALTTSKWKG